MSDFSQFSPSGSGTREQVVQPSSQNTQRAEPKDARIIGVPNDLRETKEPVRLRGNVERVNDDGTIRVRTPRGDIDVRIEGNNARPPQQGERVEIEVQPGRPPTQATVQLNPRPEAHRAPPLAQERPAEIAPTRKSATPVRVDITRPQTTPSTPPPQETLARQDTIRLLPLAPDLIKEVVLKPIEILQAVLSQVATTSLAPAIILKIQNVQTLQEPLAAKPNQTQAQTQGQITTPPQKPIVTPKTPPITTAVVITTPTPSAHILSQSFPALNFETISALFTQNPLQPIIRNAISTVLTPIVPITELGILVQNPNVQSATSITTQPVLEQVQPQPPTSSIGLQSLSAEVTSISLPPVQIIAPHVQAINPSAETLPPVITTTINTFAPQNPFINVPFLENFTPDEKSAPIHTAPLILQEATTPQTSTATIIGFIEGSHAVVTFAQSAAPTTSALNEMPLFVLQDSAAALPVGTQITTLVHTDNTSTLAQGAQLAALTIPPLGAPLPADLLAPARPWLVMDQILQALSANTPQAAQAFTNMIPSASAPSHFGTAAMFFMAALKGGDLTSWLGDKANNLLRASGKSALSNRLSQEGTLLSRARSEATAQEWRGVAIPHAWQNNIDKIALYFKQDGESDEADDSKDKQTRFLFDLNLDKMGDVQLDGLFRFADTNHMRLDLILRTGEKFHEISQMEMRRIYASALKQTQVTGELSFQTDPKQWVHVTQKNEKFGAEA